MVAGAKVVDPGNTLSSSSSYLASRIANPNGLLPLQSQRGRGANGRVDIVVMSNSVGRGVGSGGDPTVFTGQSYAGTVQVSGQNGVPYTSSDNYLGWVGTLRSKFAAQSGVDPGEGFIFSNDPRFEYDGGASAATTTGPQGISCQLTGTGQYIQLNQTIMSGGFSNTFFSTTQYIGIVVWDSNNPNFSVAVNGSAATPTTRPGGNVPLVLTGSTGKYYVGYVPCPTAGQTFKITGPSTGTAFICGFDLVNSPNGVHVHNVGQSGFVTADMLGGQTVTSGVPSYALSASQRDRVIRSSFQWLGGGQTTRTATATIATSGLMTLTSGYVDAQDVGAVVTGTGIPSNTTITQYLSSTTCVIQSGSAPSSGTGVTVTITPQTTPGLVIIASEELNDYTQQGPCTPLRTLSGYIASSVLTLTSGNFYLTDPGNVQLAGSGISGGGGLANIGTITSATTATLVSTGGSTISDSGSAGSPNSYTSTPTSVKGCNTPTTSTTNVQNYLLGQNGGDGPLAEGWTALIVGGPRRYPDGTTTPAGTSPLYSQSSFISAIASLAGLTTTNSLLSQVGAFDLSTVLGSTSTMRTNGIQYASGSVHPTLEGHGAIAQIMAELWNELTTFNVVTATVPS